MREVGAAHVAGADNLSDRFVACIALPDGAEPLQFCIRFEAGGATHWDNNAGANYVLLPLC